MSLDPKRAFALVERHLPAIMEGAAMHASATGAPPEDVALLAAIAIRESAAGQALRPRGVPEGTGDWTARVGAWRSRAGVRLVDALPPGWSPPKRAGQVLPGPYAIPLDGLGWGRGVFQIDILGDLRDLIPPAGAPWPLERQAYAACAQLALNRRELAPWASHPLHERAVVARYNAALERVRAGLEAGDPDIATTGGDYGRDVLATRDALRGRFPERFPVPRREVGVA